jgi:ubiquitin-conjugating enzyme (huntingtin interacting protein 2)
MSLCLTIDSHSAIVWHPNISSQTGAICLDILKDQWSPALTIKTALLSLQALLCSAEPSDPQDAEVANMYQSNYEQFCSTAKFWTECYAFPKEAATEVCLPMPTLLLLLAHYPSQNAAVQRLVDMGFPQEQVIDALGRNGGDENAAVNFLLSSL